MPETPTNAYKCIHCCLSLSAGADPSGGNADLSSHAHHVTLQTSSRAVHWTCSQPSSGSFTHNLPRKPSNLDVLVVRREGANHTHRDFRATELYSGWLPTTTTGYLIQDFDQDLADLVATYHRHTRCSALHTKHGKQECRFGYPKALQPQTAIVTEDEPTLLTARNDGMINSFNPVQLSAMAC